MSPIRLEGPSLWFCPDCQGDEPDGDYLERLAAPSRPMPLRPGAIARVNAPAAAAATGEPGEQTG
jgi:hypothetical protein